MAESRNGEGKVYKMSLYIVMVESKEVLKKSHNERDMLKGHTGQLKEFPITKPETS